MVTKKLKKIRGWLLFYIISSIPVLLFYAAGLSGWFFDYPLALMLTIFILLAIPLLLILVKYPKAPQANIVMLWSATILIIIRIIYGLLFQALQEGRAPTLGQVQNP